MDSNQTFNYLMNVNKGMKITPVSGSCVSSHLASFHKLDFIYSRIAINNVKSKCEFEEHNADLNTFVLLNWRLKMQLQ